MSRLYLVLALCAGCAPGPRGRPPWQIARSARPPDECGTAPALAAATGFRHRRSRLIAAAGEARHRGFDLVTSASAERQLIEGEVAYAAIDKALEDEDVVVHACIAGRWIRLGGARTDGEGRFALALAGAARMPVGLHDLYLSVLGDRTGVWFLADVAPGGTQLVVTDVDGTLTSSEHAAYWTILFGTGTRIRPGSARALADLAARGYQPVYLTARSRRYTEATRSWLADHGLPRGPILLARGLTWSRDAALEHKTRALIRLETVGLTPAIGLGNRASDIAAYGRAGIRADHVFIETSEYPHEVTPLIQLGRARGFRDYGALRAVIDRVL